MSANSMFKKSESIQWVLDWDGTITKKDTLDALVSISAATRHDFPTMHHWHRVSQAYVDDYTATLEQLVPGGVLPTTVEDEKRLLKELKNVEQRSLDRVSSSSIFAGLTKRILGSGAQQAINSRQVELRDDFVPFFQYAQSRKNDEVVMLSVNWSRHFIQSCLRSSGVSLPSSSILSNEFDGIDDEKSSTGYIVSPTTSGTDTIISSGDKLERLERLREHNKRTVYVGDSWTDLESLLAADLGICIRDEPIGSSQTKLAEALNRLGIQCPRLCDRDEIDDSGLVWARNFTEIQNWAESRQS